MRNPQRAGGIEIDAHPEIWNSISNFIVSRSCGFLRKVTWLRALPPSEAVSELHNFVTRVFGGDEPMFLLVWLGRSRPDDLSAALMLHVEEQHLAAGCKGKIKYSSIPLPRCALPRWPLVIGLGGTALFSFDAIGLRELDAGGARQRRRGLYRDTS